MAKNNKINFRINIPTRTYVGKQLSSYRLYKDHLRKDFYNKCGYTDCSDFWFGGKRNFQIDHFKSQSKHPKLINVYSNLVYSCSYINRAKSDDDEGDYIDPCDTDYNEHFYRDKLGNIYPEKESTSANYMYIQLKLYLRRYSIIWMLEQLEEKMEFLRKLLEKDSNKEILALFSEVTFAYMDYKKYLRSEQ